MRTRATTTVQATLNLQDLRELPIPLPDRHERDKATSALRALDDRIELNRRMNRTLESIARAIFGSWFIDFDPVRKKMEGGEVGLPPDLAALFPSTLTAVGDDEVPLGWHVGPCHESFMITMGQSPPGSTYNEAGRGLPFYQGRRDFGRRYPTRRVYCVAPSRCARSGDTLVSVRAPVGDVNMAREECCIGRGLAAVRHVSGATAYTYEMMRSLRRRFDDFESGGTVFGSINSKDFRELRVIVPPPSVIEAFETILAPVLQILARNDTTSRLLVSTRDTIMPRLLKAPLPLGGPSDW